MAPPAMGTSPLRTGAVRPRCRAVRIDVRDLHGFYAGPLGAVAGRTVGRAVASAWPNLRGLSVLGLGYALPYLDELDPACERALAFMPAIQGVIRWPREAASRTALADPLMLPLSDGCLDRVLVVHALETVESPAELLQEVARVLVPSGRAIIVCPNRRGLWARLDTTPFGQGQPFSRSQLRRLMRETSLAPERWTEALYVPPLASRLLLRGANLWERVGVGLSLPFAGLHVVEATKQWLRPVPARSRRRRAARAPVLVPVPASRTCTRDG